MASRRRDTFKATIIKLAKKVKDLNDESLLSELNFYQENLSVTWTLFRETHFDVLDVTGDEFIEFQNIEYSGVEDVYNAANDGEICA